jgi:hypothetical protein
MGKNESRDRRGENRAVSILLPTFRSSIVAQVHLKLHFTRGYTSCGAAGEKDSCDVGSDSDDEIAEQQPNELHITVVQARRLVVMNRPVFVSGGSSDPLVRLYISGFDQQKTPFIRNTLAPVWCSRHVFSGVVDSALSLVAVVNHSDRGVFAGVSDSATFMGKIAIPLNQFHDLKGPSKVWFTLRNMEGEADGILRGEIELIIDWKFNIEVYGHAVTSL